MVGADVDSVKGEDEMGFGEENKESSSDDVSPTEEEPNSDNPHDEKEPSEPSDEEPSEPSAEEAKSTDSEEKADEKDFVGALSVEEVKAGVTKYSKPLNLIRKELAKSVIGQSIVIDGMLRALLAGGNVLVEGAPGLGKTLMIKSLAKVLGCKYSRIQFTVDLLPTDIVGITVYDEHKGFYTIKGPIFANFILADEINRAPAKTQSALMEAMQEHQVTIGRKTYPLDSPFFVMATQNPLESGGTYKLPEAQVDRFLFKLITDYPEAPDEKLILTNNMTLNAFSTFQIKPVIVPQDILDMQKFVKNIFLEESIKEYIVNLIIATRKPKEFGVTLGKYVDWGGSPRASISLFIAAKAQAMIKGCYYVTPQHVKDVAFDVLRHRVSLNYEAQAEGISSEQVIKEILSKVPIP